MSVQTREEMKPGKDLGRVGVAETGSREPSRKSVSAASGFDPARGWQPIETAPRDGREIQARIPGHGEDNVVAWQDGFLDSDERDCCCWVFTRDQEPPECWTDGVCWASNEDEMPSISPTHWKPLPPESESS